MNYGVYGLMTIGTIEAIAWKKKVHAVFYHMDHILKAPILCLHFKI